MAVECYTVRTSNCVPREIIKFCRKLGWRDILRNEISCGDPATIYTDGFFQKQKRLHLYLQEWNHPDYNFFGGVCCGRFDVNSSFHAIRLADTDEAICREFKLVNGFFHRRQYNSASTILRLTGQYDFIKRGRLGSSSQVFRITEYGCVVVSSL